MKLRLLNIRDALADSFWFMPTLMALLAGCVALGSIALDHAIGKSWIKDIGWVWSGGAEGARSVLSVIAGSVMTVVSIVFSLTVTTLAQTSSHFGPRVLRNFTADRGVQFTLGTFISTFVYSLLVLRTVRSVEESEFVPYLSVNIGIVLSLASLAVLIFFIHHVAQSIQAENLIAGVGIDFQEALAVLFPQRIGQPHETPQNEKGHFPQLPEESQWKTAHVVTSPADGYLQRVDDKQLLRLATEHDLVLKLEKRPGHFVARSSPLVRVLPPSQMTDAIAQDLCACLSVGRQRTPHQDALYSIQQLVEIGCHALSPGINEPFTALTCIDWLGTCLRGVVEREFPTPFRQDAKGDLRVVAAALDFDEIAHAVFDQMRLYGASNPDVLLSLLDMINTVAPNVRRDCDWAILIHHAQLIGADITQIANENDRDRVQQRLAATLGTLAQSARGNKS